MSESMLFPYEKYMTLSESVPVYYPAGDETRAKQVFQILTRATEQLEQLFGQKRPELEILLLAPEDFQIAPHDEMEEVGMPHPYWTDVTSPPTIVVPAEVDLIFGEITPAKFSFMLYHALVLAFLENDPRPWPEDNPLWADEWQIKFGALWLSQTLDGEKGVINTDLFAEYDDIFEVEPDGKTPNTVRGFDWYEDTSPEDYLCYQLLLEQMAADLLQKYPAAILPRFLALYRVERDVWLSDEVTSLLASVLGPGGEEWLEDLVYF
ncbi:hypothetical protein [Ktedonobacter robiniae]|uniref:Uncharacterized protein n=1 Tax=Ktedonobacter robiniae TaxID=2778365 RepID=A0ABQ3URF3_9CHLR|nr:hypothetical protein [Ktedonobacter robiniae]GHO55282.1 hypothetical protein KSB_37570 [Ktedonobacter robiniae]